MSASRSIVIFGSGAVSMIVRTLLEHDSPHRVAALTVDREAMATTPASDLPLVPFDEVTRRYPPSGHGMFVAVGYSRMNAVRAARLEQAREMGYELITHVSSRASIGPGARVGANTVVMEDCTVGPLAHIGDDCIVWPRSYVGHEAEIGDHCYIAAGASISGRTRIGPRCVMGSACVVRDQVAIGEACVVGVGAVVTRDLAAFSVVAAPEARLLPGRSDRLPSL